MMYKVNTNRPAFCMSLYTISDVTCSTQHLMHDMLLSFQTIFYEVTQTKFKRNYEGTTYYNGASTALFWGCIYICSVDPQRFPLRWQPSRWLSVERGRKQTLRRHFGIATARE
jgi:hypothetical protein